MNLHARKQMPDPDPSGGGGGGGGGTPPWHGAFAADAPQEFRDWVGTKAFPNAQSALLSAFNAEKLIGADKERTVIWPKDENDKDGWKAVHSRLGVPEKAEAYELAAAQGEDGTFVAEAAKWMLARGVPKSAAQGLIADLRAFAKTQGEARVAKDLSDSKAELAALDTEWGTAKDANKALGKRFGAELGLTEADMNEIEGAIGTAKFMRMMHKGGTKLGEQGTVPGGGEGGFGLSQIQAREKLEAGRADRAAGKMSEKDWLELNSKLAPIAYPAQAA